MLHLIGAIVPVPYPSWLNTGDNTWQMIAATFVGLMSLPGLAVLYASIVPKKWAVNVLAMMFAGFSLVLIAWVLWSYKMGFGATSLGAGVTNGVQTQLTGVGWVKHFFDNFVGKPGRSPTPPSEQGQAVSAANTVIPFHFPTDVAGLLPVRLRRHHPAAVPGERARPDQVQRLVPAGAAVVDLRLRRRRLPALGRRLLRPGGMRSTSPVATSSTCRPVCPGSWRPGSSGPGCCGIDNMPCPTTSSWRPSEPASCGSAGTASTVVTRTTPGPSAASAVVNTNLATAVGVVVWMAMDAWLTKARKPTFLGGVNGMICGLVGITPCAGWVNGWGAIVVGAICCAVVWVAWNFLSKVRPFSKVDDALGVIYTHGIAGFMGGMLLGIFGDPNMVEYGCGHLNASGQVINTTSSATYVASRGQVRAVLGERADVHRLGPPVVGTVPSGRLGHLLVGAGDLHLDEADRAGAPRGPLQGRASSRSATWPSTTRRPSPRRPSPPGPAGAFAMAGLESDPSNHRYRRIPRRQPVNGPRSD